MDQIDIKNIISDVAKLAIRDHLDVIENESTRNLSNLLDKIKKLTESAKTGLYQIKEQIMKVFQWKDNMYERADFGVFFEFCIQRKVQGK